MNAHDTAHELLAAIAGEELEQAKLWLIVNALVGAHASGFDDGYAAATR